MRVYDTSFISSLNSVFTFASHLLVLLIPISYGLSFSPFYATSQLEYFGVSFMVIPALLKFTSHVAEVSPFHRFGSLNILYHLETS